ncbi:MAG: pirin family protein [Pseudomonadota bacterium]
MSWHDCTEAECRFTAADIDPIETVIVPRSHDIGGFEVRRALPSRQKRMVGPFVFFDQMGPSEFLLGNGLDVRPHPHIGLATVTYLFRGEIVHKDSLGTDLPIRPGAVNWMTAGRGIAHSERTGPEERARGAALFGIQAWVALPRTSEETDPAFWHHAATDMPVVEDHGVRAQVIAGGAFGHRSPVPTHTDMVYVDLHLQPNARVPIDASHVERALYVAEGEVEIAGIAHPAGELLVFRPGDALTVTALRETRAMLLGGEPMDGPRYIWWNFVSSSKERIEHAKRDWLGGRFDAVPGEVEFIPLPDTPGP